MKKYLVLILLIFSVFTTGCSGFSVFGKEIIPQSAVYCDNCGFKSDKKTKTCETCKEKPIWLSKKPKITRQIGKRLEDEKAAEFKKQKEKDEKEALQNNKQERVVVKTKVIKKKEKKKEKYDTCGICGREDKISNLTHVHGVGVYVHSKCGDNAATCANCSNTLFTQEENRTGYCDVCYYSQNNNSNNNSNKDNDYNSDDSYNDSYDDGNYDYSDYDQYQDDKQY